MRFTSGTKVWHSRPFSVRAKKVTWSVGTDGMVLFALKAEGASPGTNIPKDDLVSMLHTPSKKSIEIPLADLKVWAGTPSASLIPDGEVPPEHQGILAGKSIDRRKLAYLLAPVSFPVVRVWQCSPDCLGFEEDKNIWRGFLATLDGPIDSEDPVFKIGKKATTVFDVAEEVGVE